MEASGSPTDADLRRAFAAELRAARAGRAPDPGSGLDPVTRDALAAVARTHPGGDWRLVDAAHDAFSAWLRRRERATGPRAPRPPGPVTWAGDDRRSTAHRDGAVVGAVERHDYELPRFGTDGDVRWGHGGASYEAVVHGEPLTRRFGSMAAARAAVDAELR